MAIRNRVDESGILSLDLGDLVQNDILSFDMHVHLWEGFVLREKPFRQALKELLDADYQNRYVALFCSSDAVIPDWAWMLATSRLTLLGANVQCGNPEAVKEQLLLSNINNLDTSDFVDARVVIKGCSEAGGPQALAQIIRKLQPVAQSIMYGEPCSTVPIFKRPKA